MPGISGGLSNGEQPIEIVLALSGRIRHGYTGSGQSNRKGDGDGEHATRGGRHEIPNATQKAHGDRKSTRLNSSHVAISYAVFCLKKKKKTQKEADLHRR